MDECLSNAKLQDRILNERIEAQKKYKISSILVNQFWRLMGINTLNDIELLKSYNRNEKK